MQKLHIAIIHGIGKNGTGFSADLTKGIAWEFNQALQRILKISGDYSKDLNFIEIVWDDILAINQAHLAYIFRKEFERRDRKEKINFFAGGGTFLAVVAIFSFIFKNPWAMTFIGFGGFFVLKIIVEKLRTGIAAEFINDIISFRESGAQNLILGRVEERLEPLINISSTTKVSFISHSLGTVIASDYVWEGQKAGNLFNKKLNVSNFFTMGSPLPLFSLQFGGPEMFNKPFAIQDADGRWINIYDNDDPIAYPLKCLNDAYDQTVLRDQEVSVGLLGIAHVNYWKSGEVARIIAYKFVLDWLRENKQLPLEEIQKLAEKYDKTLKIFP